MISLQYHRSARPIFLLSACSLGCAGMFVAMSLTAPFWLKEFGGVTLASSNLIVSRQHALFAIDCIMWLHVAIGVLAIVLAAAARIWDEACPLRRFSLAVALTTFSLGSISEWLYLR